MMVNAVIFVPRAADENRWLQICASYCARHRYNMVAVAHDWDDVLVILARDEAAVAVVARRDQLPPERKHRLEVVNEAATEPLLALDRSQRRVRRVRVAR